MDKFSLELDVEQLMLVSKAVDFFARIQTGQISEMINPYMVALPNADYTDIEKKIIDLKHSMFPELPENAHYSIRSKQLSDTVRQMIDIHEVIKFTILPPSTEEDQDNRPRRPFQWSTEKQLPTIKKVS